MSMYRTLPQETLRAVLVAGAVLVPLFWPTDLPVTPAVLAVFLAYDGAARRGIAAAAGMLVCAELVGGFELGLQSLPYLAAAVLLVGIGRLIPLVPWAGADGWHPADVVRTGTLALVLTAAMTAGSALMTVLSHGSAALPGRFTLAFSGDVLAGAVVVVGIVLIVVRRIDVPFRRTIRFGV